MQRIVAKFGTRAVASVRPSEVKAWMAELPTEGLADSTIYALPSRLGQLYSDAVHDGLVPRSPVSRRSSPDVGKHRPYVAVTAQVWALHDALPEHFRPVVLLGAFAGLRVAEIAASGDQC
jgi:site-specific recombinase XerC